MGRSKYDLQVGENIIYKTTGVKHGFWGNFTDELVLTNQSVLWIKIGAFDNVKEIVRFPLESISQAISGKSKNGWQQLEIYLSDGVEAFEFPSQSERELKIWTMAIRDRFSDDKELYDFNYYQRFSEENLKNIRHLSEDENNGFGINGEFIGDVAKNIIKSGNYSVNGIMKGVAKASRKQAYKSEFAQGLKDELGITDIQDEFTEIGNDFREMVGLKPKMTQREKKEQQLNEAFNLQLEKAQQEVKGKNMVSDSYDKQEKSPNDKKMSIDEQIETIKKLKELVDAEILTQEEFEIKKKEVMGL